MLFCELLGPTGLPSPIITPMISLNITPESPVAIIYKSLNNHSLLRLHQPHSLNMRISAFAVFFIASVSLFSSTFFLCDLVDVLTEFWQVLPMPRPLLFQISARILFVLAVDARGNL
jgi:hypothetical protein